MADGNGKNQQAQSSSSSASTAAADEQREATGMSPALARTADDFNRAHGELKAEAAAMAAECGVDVHVIAFLPGGDAATKHTFLGIPPDATVAAEEAKRNQAVAKAAKDKAKLMAFVGKDVSKMTMEEAKTHREKLMNLRANVIRKLQQKVAPATSIAGGGGDDEDEDGHRNKISKIGSSLAS
uniref:Uncharacterized protein n=1 Tax=Leersia perrieri TaxID=77586 RepID=A0A0D9X457_9ORYZ